ncbi:SpoIIE family protein phosphatase [Candidatus Uabimicrobium sp. HlEnr_7]|uniref:protein kinase domain-containing protein n=1 Tax=Candidatus Uabimicrobium helgolandensis TaxID=3095367 RepID=UPI00355629C4
MHTYKTGDIIDNRYKLTKLLGSGRVGKVYLATDQNNNKNVALKMLIQSLDSEREQTLFKREFISIKNLNHPGVVKVFEQGENFFTMEYVDGSSLNSLKEYEFSQIFDVCTEITKILDYIHKQGVIHRDLKPDNIKINSKLEPKILDFGFATYDNVQNFLDPKADIMGTLNYMAPEMIKGFQIDTRADLYSLGVLFYELVTGEVPFKSNDIITTVLKQVETTACLPSKVNPKIVPGFETIIMKLIEKSPAKRFQSAEELLGAMLKLAGKSEIRDIKIERGEHLLSNPKFCGRENELKQLSLGFSKALKGRGYFITISGESGIGKTALLKHFQSQIAEGTISILADCTLRTSTEYPIFSQAIEQILEHFKKEAPNILSEILDRWGNVLWSLNPNLFEQDNYYSHIKPEKPLANNLIEEKICEFFIEISKYHFLSLFADNIHNLDEKNCQLLLKFVQKTQNISLFVCCTHNSFLESAQIPLHKFTSSFQWKKICEEIELTPLKKDDVKNLFSSMVNNQYMDSNVLDKLYEVSCGVPILLEESIKKLANDGLIYQKGGLWVIDIDDLRKIKRPNLLEESLLEKYTSLNEKELQIIQLAAIAGHPLSQTLIEKILNSQTLNQVFEKLITTGFILEKNQSYVIGSQKLAKKIYNKIPVVKKRGLHKKIAEQLEEQDLQNNIENLAYHYTQASQTSKAFYYLTQSGDMCKKQYLYSPALNYYHKAINIGYKTTPQQQIDLLIKLGNIHLFCGQYKESLTVFEKSLLIVQQNKLETNNAIDKGIGDSAFKNGLFDKAIHHYKNLLTNLRNQGQKIAEELLTMASIYIVMGSYNESEKLLSESLELAKSEKNIELQASIYSSFASIHAVKGQLPNAMNHYLMAFKILHSSENLPLKAKVAEGIARTYIRKGQIDLAYRYLEEASYICNMVGDRERFIIVKINLGKLFELRGQFSRSLKIYKECLSFAEESQVKIGEGYALLEISRAMNVLEQDTEALQFIKRAIKIFDDLKIQSASATAYKILGQTYAAQGKISEAQEIFSLSETLFLSLNMKWALSDVYLSLSETLADDEANKTLNKALKISKKHDDDIMSAKIHTRYAIFCSKRGHNQQALEHFVSAIVLLERVVNKLELAKAYFEYGKALLHFEKEGEKGFIKVAINQLEKAKEIYIQAEIVPLQNKTNLLIKQCKRETSTVDYKKDIGAKLREFGQEISACEREYQKQIQNFKKQLEASKDMGQEYVDSIQEKLSGMQKQFEEQLQVLTSKNTTLINQVQELKAERESLLTLQKVSTTINSVLDSKKLFDLIMDMVIRELKAERGFVVLNDNDTLNFKAARNIDEKELSTSESNLSTSIVQKVIKTGEPVLTSDAQADGRFQSQSIVDLKLRSILCVPFNIKDKTIGAVYVDNRLVSGLFTEHDLDFLISFSNQAAIALENAFLYEELREKERIEQEISIAAKIQSGLLPKTLPEIQGINVYGKMIPARQVGGDYYDFITHAENETLSIVIGDVSGKGVPAGLVMVMARLILHHFLYNSQLSTKEILLETNSILKDNTEPFIFMSMLLVHWNNKTQKLVYTGAGHENLITIRGDTAPEATPAGGVVLGVKDNITDFLEEKELQLNAGDKVVFYTDGVTDAMSPTGDMLEMDGLLEIINHHRDKNPQDMVYGILEDLESFMKDQEQHDDITLTVLEKL